MGVLGFNSFKALEGGMALRILLRLQLSFPLCQAGLEGIFSAWGYEVPTVQGAFIKTIIEF